MITNARPTAYALTIAGSDSGGGAGIQADLRSFASQGVFGLTALTAITAQNTRAVSQVQMLPTRMVRAQIDAVLSDFPVGAVKTGMLGSGAITRCVAGAIRDRALPWIVDPVMIASSGARLLDQDAERSLLDLLLPRATVLTPNIPEAEVLLGRSITRSSQMAAAAAELRTLGAQAVLLKGGHLSGRTVVDIYCDADGVTEFAAPRRRFQGHGTGCTLASLLAARFALGERGLVAVTSAIGAFRQALDGGVTVGRGDVYVPYPVGVALRQ